MHVLHFYEERISHPHSQEVLPTDTGYRLGYLGNWSWRDAIFPSGMSTQLREVNTAKPG